MTDRLSGVAWIEAPDCDVGVVLELIALIGFALDCDLNRFCANLLNLSKFRCRVKLRFRGNLDCHSPSTAGRFSCLFDRLERRKLPAAEGRTAQNFKQRPATKSPRAFCAHKRNRLLGHAMVLFSAGFPTGVRGAPSTTSSNPTNRLPTSHLGQATSATGGSTAHLQLSKNSTGYSRMQIANRLALSTVSRLSENNNDPSVAQLNPPVERHPILWESPSSPRQTSPRLALNSYALSPKSPADDPKARFLPLGVANRR